MEKQDVKAELIKYYQTKYQSAPNAYPGSGGIESMFKELDSEGVDIEIIRKVIITAIDRKFDSFMPISGGFKEVLSKVAEAHPNSELASRTLSRSVRESQVDRVVNKYR